MSSAEVSMPIFSHQQEIFRATAVFPEDIWGDRFTSFTLDQQLYEKYAKEMDTLKEEVRKMLVVARKSKMAAKLHLIDTIERLGLYHHFDKEIDEQLEQVFNNHAHFEDYADYDLCTAACQFRVLRQHGFNISLSIFDKFMDENGKFKESLSSDIKGLLSLYEAAHVGTREDSILEEALSFTTSHLKPWAEKLTSCSLQKLVKHALEQSLQRSIQRLETRHYISVCEEDESKNELLLRLAKLDYNCAQMFHKQELCELSRWWKKHAYTSKLPYTRDRVVEVYFLALGVYTEPHEYSLGRVMLAKTIAVTSIIDDTYDAYGTLDELDALTRAVERWNTSEIDRLPGYMPICYKALLDVTNELDEYLTKLEKPYAMTLYKEDWIKYARSSNNQTKWSKTRDLPPFAHYLSEGLITSTYYLIIGTSFMGMNSANKAAFDWLASNPKIVEASAVIGRLFNDIASYETEKQRGATGIDCYMKDCNVSEAEAMKKIGEMVEDAWKDINKECLGKTTMPREILIRVLNFARIMDVTYKHHEDGYTDPRKVIEPNIVALFEDPIIV